MDCYTLPPLAPPEIHGFLQQAKVRVAEYAQQSKAANTWKAYHSDFADFRQLENRFEPFLLPRWDNDADLGRLLASFEATLPLREPSDLSGPALRALILRRSEGTMGEISALLNAAACLALSMGRERIDADIINEVNYRPPSERRRLFEASL